MAADEYGCRFESQWVRSKRADDPLLETWSFLLIVRAGHIVTSAVRNPSAGH